MNGARRRLPVGRPVSPPPTASAHGGVHIGHSLGVDARHARAPRARPHHRRRGERGATRDAGGARRRGPPGHGAVRRGPRRPRGPRPPGLRRDHRVRIAGEHRHPGRAHGRTAGRARAVACGRHGPARRDRGRAGDAAAAGPQPGDGLLGRPGGPRRPRARAARPRADAGRARARLARSERRPGPPEPLRPGADRRGNGLRSRRRCHSHRRGARPGGPPAGGPAGQGRPGPHQRHRRHPRNAVPRPARPRRAAAPRRHHRGDDRRGPARHRPRLRTPTSRHSALRSGRPRAPATSPGCSRARRSSPATASATTGCRTPTRCGARRRCTAPPSTRSATPA